jgi:hypothetical protein
MKRWNTSLALDMFFALRLVSLVFHPLSFTDSMPLCGPSGGFENLGGFGAKLKWI